MVPDLPISSVASRGMYAVGSDRRDWEVSPGPPTASRPGCRTPEESLDPLGIRPSVAGQNVGWVELRRGETRRRSDVGFRRSQSARGPGSGQGTRFDTL